MKKVLTPEMVVKGSRRITGMGYRLDDAYKSIHATGDDSLAESYARLMFPKGIHEDWEFEIFNFITRVKE